MLSQEEYNKITGGKPIVTSDMVQAMAGGAGGGAIKAVKGVASLAKPAASKLGAVANKFTTALKANSKKVLGATALASGGAAAGTYMYNKKAGPDYTPTFSDNTPTSTPGLNHSVGTPASFDDTAGGGSGARGESNKNAARQAQIGKGWDDTDDEFGAAKSALSASGKYISNLGKVKDQYLRSNEEYKRKTDEAIAGNRRLIEENQKNELDDLAGDTRKSVDNTNVMLGIKGATGGSASRAASRAISEMAGKKRAETLTMRGDEMSHQEQESQNAVEQYKLRREQAYKWEEDARKQAVIEYEADKKALDRLKKKAPDWKKSDLDADSDNKLQSLLANLANISARAKTFREGLAAKMTEFGGAADALESEAVTVDAPAELMTPNFDENIDLNDPNNTEDFFDPNNTGKKRVIKGYDSFGNPIFEDELAIANA